jgi:hypothetical protein
MGERGKIVGRIGMATRRDHQYEQKLDKMLLALDKTATILPNAPA